jgi:hypothetical protein
LEVYVANQIRYLVVSVADELRHARDSTKEISVSSMAILHPEAVIVTAARPIL